VGVVGISSDLTERKALETQLRLSQRMEAIGRLAGGIAHDFNNVLTVVQGNVQLLLLDMQNETLRGNVEEIGSASKRAAGLTRQLLAFSRQQVLRPKVLDLARIVHEMEEMLRRLIGEHIELSVLGDRELGYVEADPAQIGQVVMNLAVNARDAMPDGGKLTIRLENAELDKSLDDRLPYDVLVGPYVLLSVSDTGTGMDAETISRIFEPFFTTKSLDKGTGLGLPMVYGVVKQSGGYIWVDSEPGEGSTFRIYFPRVEAELDRDAPDDSEPVAAPERTGRTILLCEDEAPVRSIARRVLERAGFHVLEAESGEQAMHIANKHLGPIHLVLSDVVMPRMGGRELLSAVRERRPGIRALLMSGYARREFSEGHPVDAGVPFLEKPFTPAELVASVGKVLREEVSAS
jgi:two-component system, cell cycle sensor histidine kinase and response regulator CckA